MEIEITEQNAEKLLRETFAKFVDEELIPIARDIDERDEFPRDIFKKLAEMGAYGLRYPKEYGGSQGTATMFCIMCEELARGSMAVAAFTAMQCLMGTNFIYAHGTEEQKQKLLIPAIKAEKVAAFALTEPDAGSDLMALATSAKKQGTKGIELLSG
jgi:alkylation response protein AidB-like acyl-CoA dehydrogenase